MKLLRVLQDRTYEILGSSKAKTVDVRVICATNKNLEEMVNNGQFREDLFYRINLMTIKLPALREGSDDIPLLVNYFLENFRQTYNRPNLEITLDALNWLKQLYLPGNIRQLKNIVERLVLINKKDILNETDFKSQVEALPKNEGLLVLPNVGAQTLEEIEIQMIQKAMEFHKNKITRVAQALGITRMSLYRRLKKFKINYDEDSE